MILGTFSQKLIRLLFAAIPVFVVITGCDRPPAPPKTADEEHVKVISIAPSERGELQAAAAVEAAKVNYRYRLQVLQGYYDKVGNMDKLIWTQREMKNLDQVQTFAWEGLPDITPPIGESLEDADERILVEYVVQARTDFKNAMEELAQFYQRSDQNFKAALIHNMQDRLDPIRTYMYFFSAEIPPADLRPVAIIPEADALFAEALRLYKSGKGILRIALTTNYQKQRQALLTFHQLIDTYPTSNKIAESAYYIAEIYKEYFNEDIRAVHWYQRAWQWDPNITKPARFQAATVHDIRLHNYAQAVECYKLTIQHEQFNPSNVRYAHQRITELTGK